MALILAAPAPAAGEAGSTATSSSAAPVTFVPSGLPDAPDDYAVDASAALGAAERDPKIIARKEEAADDPDALTASVDSKAVRVWEVSYFLGGEKVNLVVVDGVTGEVTESWTGVAVAWPMARGHDGQFGHILNAPWVWGPLAAIFFLGLLDFRRWRKWVHLDLLVLLSFGVSHLIFGIPHIATAVWLFYPPLIYLLARMLWIGFRGAGSSGTASEGLRPSMPTWLMTTLVVALIALRIAANVADSGVIDVGYAGAVGADKITHGQPIYGDESFPENNPTGDTYGPANYFAYVPFEAIFPWSGEWDELPSAHAAAIFFDLATIAGLFMLGRALTRRSGGEAGRFRSNSVGLALAFAWVAYPYTAFALQSNSNDALVSALLVWSLVAFASPLARGGLVAAAGLTKFAPLVLAPLYAAGERGIRIRVPDARHAMLRPLALFAAAFVAGAVLLMAHPAVDPGLADFYDRTIRSQVERDSPFSIWGQVDLGFLRTAVEAGVVIGAITLAFVPKRRSLVQVAALSAALIIAVELTLVHWFYLYIPWFLGAMLAATVARPRSAEPPPSSAHPAGSVG